MPPAAAGIAPVFALALAAALTVPVRASEPASPAESSAVAGTAAITPAESNTPPSTSATQAPPAPVLAGDRWMIRLSPRVWFVAPSGDVRLPGSTDEVDVRDLDIDEPTLQPMGEANVQAGNFLFSFSGGAASTHSDGAADSGFTLGGVSVASGDGYDMDMDLLTFNITAGYKVWQHVFEESARPGEHVLRVWLIGGARLNDLDMDFSSGGGSASSSDVWFDIIGGVRVEAQFFESFSLDIEVNAGGMTDSLSADLTVGLSWRPVDWAAIQGGYRILFMDYQDGSGSSQSSFSGSMAGMFFGATLRF